MIPRLNVPMQTPKDVQRLLGAPRHWKQGRSAYLLAHSWFEANDVPTMVRLTLSQEKRFATLDLIDAFFERKIELGDRLQPSQTDVLAVLGLEEGLAVMAVEGKVDEPFGKTVADWLDDAPPRSRKKDRLKSLLETLQIDAPHALDLRYQLIHRTASALYEAHRYRARIAVMMVQSFDPGDVGIDDYLRFAEALGLNGAGATRLSGPVIRGGVELYLGWTADRPSNEGFTVVNGRKTDAGFHDLGE